MIVEYPKVMEEKLEKIPIINKGNFLIVYSYYSLKNIKILPDYLL